MMSFITGLIIFVVGVIAGGLMSLYIVLVYVEVQKHLSSGKLNPETPAQAPRLPVFQIPITLDPERVVEVGMEKAVREEAARTARLN
jgi:ABC-type antimicrobial peptide transport system permease subunit